MRPRGTPLAGALGPAVAADDEHTELLDVESSELVDHLGVAGCPCQQSTAQAKVTMMKSKGHAGHDVALTRPAAVVVEDCQGLGEVDDDSSAVRPWSSGEVRFQ